MHNRIYRFKLCTGSHVLLQLNVQIYILMRCGKSVTQLAEHPLYNTILDFCWNSLVFSILFDEKYFVYRSIIPDYKKNNGIKGSTTLMKVTGEQSTVLSFLAFSRNVSRQKLLVYHILILIHKGAKLYSQRRANHKILISAPGLEVIHLALFEFY